METSFVLRFFAQICPIRHPKTDRFDAITSSLATGLNHLAPFRELQRCLTGYDDALTLVAKEIVMPTKGVEALYKTTLLPFLMDCVDKIGEVSISQDVTAADAKERVIILFYSRLRVFEWICTSTHPAWADSSAFHTIFKQTMALYDPEKESKDIVRHTYDFLGGLSRVDVTDDMVGALKTLDQQLCGFVQCVSERDAKGFDGKFTSQFDKVSWALFHAKKWLDSPFMRTQLSRRTIAIVEGLLAEHSGLPSLGNILRPIEETLSLRRGPMPPSPLVSRRPPDNAKHSLKGGLEWLRGMRSPSTGRRDAQPLPQVVAPAAKPPPQVVAPAAQPPPQVVAPAAQPPPQVVAPAAQPAVLPSHPRFSPRSPQGPQVAKLVAQYSEPS